jgi:hypothetical protein
MYLIVSIHRAGPRVSPASPWVKATLHLKAIKREKKNYTIHKKKKKKKKKKKIVFIK